MIDFSYHYVKNSRAVMLQVDLTRYIKAIYKIEEAKYTQALLEISPVLSAHNMMLYQLILSFQKEIVSRLEKAFKAYQAQFSKRLHHLSGHMHWWYLQELLFNSITPNTPLLSYLQEILMEYMTKQKPLVIEVLQHYFVEIIENAIDAKVRQCLDFSSFKQPPYPSRHLKIQVELRLDRSGYLATRIKDNAGGFSADFLGRWAHYQRNRAYERDLVWFAHHDRGPYALCGSHQTLRRMMVHILDGFVMEESGLYEERYAIRPRETDFRLSNRSGGHGAVIEMLSPITPPLMRCPRSPLRIFRAPEERPPDSPPVVSRPSIIAGDLDDAVGAMTALI